MTQLLNHVDFTLVVKPFKNTYCTYCSVYIHVDNKSQKQGRPSASTEYIVQYVFAGVSV